MDKVDKPENIPEEEKDDNDDSDDEDSLEDEKLNVEDIKLLANKKEELAHAEDDEEETEDKQKEESNLPAADASFYTRSMDLSEADFDLESEFKEKHLPVGIKILIGLIILVIIAAIVFFIWKNQ